MFEIFVLVGACLYQPHSFEKKKTLGPLVFNTTELCYYLLIWSCTRLLKNKIDMDLFGLCCHNAEMLGLHVCVYRNQTTRHCSLLEYFRLLYCFTLHSPMHVNYDISPILISFGNFYRGHCLQKIWRWVKHYLLCQYSLCLDIKICYT